MTIDYKEKILTNNFNKNTFKLEWFVLASLWLVAIALIVILQQISFPLRLSYNVDQLSTKIENGVVQGFYKPQQDAQGNLYIWTSNKALIDFDFAASKPIKMIFWVRSAAVAGGPATPINLLVNSLEVGQFTPDPKNPNFQEFTFNITPPPSKNQKLQVELISQAFKATGDPRVLGFMLQSVTIDKTEAWSSLHKWSWLLWLVVLLGPLSFFLSQINLIKNHFYLSYITNFILIAGFVITGLVFYLLLRIGPIDKQVCSYWTACLLYLLFAYILTFAFIPFETSNKPLLSIFQRLNLQRYSFYKQFSFKLKFLWVQAVMLLVVVLAITNIASTWTTLSSPSTTQYDGLNFVQRQKLTLGAMGEGFIYANQIMPKDTSVAVAVLNNTDGIADIAGSYWLYPRQVFTYQTIDSALKKATPYMIIINTCKGKGCTNIDTDKLPVLNNYTLIKQIDSSTPRDELLGIYQRN